MLDLGRHQIGGVETSKNADKARILRNRAHICCPVQGIDMKELLRFGAAGKRANDDKWICLLTKQNYCGGGRRRFISAECPPGTVRRLRCDVKSRRSRNIVPSFFC